MNPADILHAAMLAEAERLGLPERFPTDLLHDQRSLCKSGVPELFGWVLYRDGTHLIRLPVRSNPHELCRTLRCDFDRQHYYLGNASGLREVKFAEFTAALVTENERLRDRRG